MREHATTEFMECDACFLKPGAPTLCRSCLHNRVAVNSLIRLLGAALRIGEQQTSPVSKIGRELSEIRRMAGLS